MEEKVYCEDCKYCKGIDICEVEVLLKIPIYNYDNNCYYFKRKWWKFWIRRSR